VFAHGCVGTDTCESGLDSIKADIGGSYSEFSRNDPTRQVLASQEWLLKPTKSVSAISVAHDVDELGYPRRNTCVIRIGVKRVSTPYMLKSLLVTIFIVFGLF
jgi:hypothetical protein